MKAAYLKVGQDFATQDKLLGEKYDKLQRLETVPRRGFRFPYRELLMP